MASKKVGYYVGLKNLQELRERVEAVRLPPEVSPFRMPQIQVFMI